jgi:Zn-dependent M28 family amino/carboxypeptidase
MIQLSRRLLILSVAAACSHPKPPETPEPAAAPPAAAEASAPAVAAPPAAADPFAASDAAGKAITGDGLRDQIAKISSDEFEGRGPTTRGDVATRAYLVEQLKALGYEPGGGSADAWQQPFDLVGVKADMPATWTFSRKGKSVAMKWWDQYIAGSGVQAAQGAVKNAEVVFVGYGIQAPEYGWDDFKGKDLKGKVLLMLNNDPDWDPAIFAGTTRLYYGRWTYKYESAARQGAAGAIIIHTTPSAGYPFQVVQTSWSGERFELPETGEPRVQVKGWLTEDAAKSLVAMAGKDLAALVESARHKEFTPVPLGVTTSLSFANKVSRNKTANVYGLLRGSDPALSQELVVYSAHHDHLGIGKPDASGDKIYNGALDNASGCSQVLAIAKAFKALPAAPKRSVLILFVAGEEQGLLGSEYYATHPTVPIGKVAVDINYDGGNIWGKTKDVTYVGKGKTTLDPIVDQAAGRHGMTVKADQFPDRGSFYRSDQFSFARVGVPGLYLGAGTDFVGKPAGWGREQHEAYERTHYHQPSDQIQPDWNFDGMVEQARLGFEIGLYLANADHGPTWVPGDEFEAARKASQR